LPGTAEEDRRDVHHGQAADRPGGDAGDRGVHRGREQERGQPRVTRDGQGLTRGGPAAGHFFFSWSTSTASLTAFPFRVRRTLRASPPCTVRVAVSLPAAPPGNASFTSSPTLSGLSCFSLSPTTRAADASTATGRAVSPFPASRSAAAARAEPSGSMLSITSVSLVPSQTVSVPNVDFKPGSWTVTLCRFSPPAFFTSNSNLALSSGANGANCLTVFSIPAPCTTPTAATRPSFPPSSVST